MDRKRIPHRRHTTCRRMHRRKNFEKPLKFWPAPRVCVDLIGPKSQTSMTSMTILTPTSREKILPVPNLRLVCHLLCGQNFWINFNG